VTTRAARPHILLGAFFCVVLPVFSWADGSRMFAWTMFSGAEEYRLEVTAKDAGGQPSPVNPTLLAAHASPHTAVYLAGADHWRSGAAVIGILRAHLGELARYACAEVSAASVEVTLRERPRFSSAPRTTTARVVCPR
jgi:hypothetical protein